MPNILSGQKANLSSMYMIMENMQSNINWPPADEPENFVDGYLLYIMAQASAAASHAFHAQLAEHGVSVAIWRILASLYPDQRLNVGELARKCLTKQPTLTRQLDRLCADGWTVRENEQKDRRGVFVLLTDEGRAKAATYVDMAKRHEAQLLANYPQADVAALKSMLKQLTGLAMSQR